MRCSHNKFISYCLIGAYNEGNFECSMGMGELLLGRHIKKLYIEQVEGTFDQRLRHFRVFFLYFNIFSLIS